MDKPYTREEIDFYVSRNLDIVGQKTLADADNVRKNFAETIAKLPPEEQVLLIENRGGNVVGDREKIQMLQGGDVNGFYASDGISLSNDFRNSNVIPDSIAWSSDARGQGMVTMRHEQGHRVDKLLGNGQSPTGFLSDGMDGWGEALGREMELRKNKELITSRNAANPMGWINRQINKITSGAEPQSIQGSLYDGYREMDEHLALYPDQSSHKREAMAEMSNHRNSLYAEFNGDNARVDAELKKRYPELWPVYRDEMIPRMEKAAQGLVEQRDGNIESYAKRMQSLEKAAGRAPLDVAEARDTASRALMGHTYNADMRSMLTETAIYRFPVEEYMDSQHDAARLRDSLSGEKTYDEAKVREHAESLIAQGKIEELKTEVLSTQAENKLLERFGETRLDFKENLGMKNTDGFMTRKSILEDYDRLKQEGGAEAVERKIKNTPNMEAITNYERQRDNLLDKRKELGGEDLPDRQNAIAREILESSDKGGLNGLSLETNKNRSEFLALQRFSDVHDNIDGQIERMTGQNVSPGGKKILQEFDALYGDNGMTSVMDKVDNLKIKKDQIEDYVAAREDQYALDHDIKRSGDDIAWGGKDGVYRPLGVPAESLPENFSQTMRDEVYAHLEKGGAANLAAETDRLKLDTSNRIARTIGRPETIASESNITEKAAPVEAINVHAPHGVGRTAEIMGHIAHKAGPLIGPVIGVGVTAAAYLSTGSTAQAAEAGYSAIVPYGETQIDLARGDTKAAAKSAAVETGSWGGAAAGAAGGTLVGGPVGGIIGGVIGGVGGGAAVETLIDPPKVETIPLNEAHKRLAGLNNDMVETMSPETQSLYNLKDYPDKFAEQYGELTKMGSIDEVSADLGRIVNPNDPAGLVYNPGIDNGQKSTVNLAMKR